jgi:hypothetical protein
MFIQRITAEREEHTEHEIKRTVAETTAETMNIQTTGLKMTGSK